MVCRDCASVLPATAEFFTTRLGKLVRQCRGCKSVSNKRYHNAHAEEAKEKRACFYQKHRAEILAKQQAYRESDLDHARDMARRRWRRNLDRNHSAQTRYREAHREECAARSKAWRKANHARYTELVEKWHREHPEAKKAIAHRRRARLRMSHGQHNAADLRAQIERQRGQCFYCGTRFGSNYHVDHVVPLASGGSNGPENIVIACPECNLKKHATHPMDFAGILF